MRVGPPELPAHGVGEQHPHRICLDERDMLKNERHRILPLFEDLLIAFQLEDFLSYHLHFLDLHLH